MSYQASPDKNGTLPQKRPSQVVDSSQENNGSNKKGQLMPKIKKSVLSLLNDACKYSAYSEYSMPGSFLRNRRETGTESTSKKDAESARVFDTNEVKGRGSNVRTSPKPAISTGKGRKTNVSNNRSSVVVPSPEPENLSRGEKEMNGNMKGQVRKRGRPPKVRIPEVQNQTVNEAASENSFHVEAHSNPSRATTSFIDNSVGQFSARKNIFDTDFSVSSTDFTENLVHSRSVNDPKRISPNVVKLKSLLYPDFEEEYAIEFRGDLWKYNPMIEIGRIIEYTLQIYVPKKYSRGTQSTILKPLNEAFDQEDPQGFINAVQSYNKLLEKIPRTEVIDHLRSIKKIPTSFYHHLLHMVYVRIIHPNASSLKEYEAFSNYVYGELLPSFLTTAYAQCNLKPDDVFMDLGSGVGNCVLQAALEFGCDLSFGCELMAGASKLTDLQNQELINRCKLLGLHIGSTQFSLRQSFVENKVVQELLPKVDVLLVNNFIFDAKLNLQIQKLIQTLKPGCKIITLKNLRPFGYSIDFNDVENILNRLKVERFDLQENSVSWTHRGGEYYISTVGIELDEAIFTTHSKGRIRAGRKVKYTR